MLGWMNLKLESRLKSICHANDTTLMAESEEELTASWWRWKDSEKAGKIEKKLA